MIARVSADFGMTRHVVSLLMTQWLSIHLRTSFSLNVCDGSVLRPLANQKGIGWTERVVSGLESICVWERLVQWVGEELIGRGLRDEFRSEGIDFGCLEGVGVGVDVVL